MLGANWDIKKMFRRRDPSGEVDSKVVNLCKASMHWERRIVLLFFRAFSDFIKFIIIDRLMGGLF